MSGPSSPAGDYLGAFNAALHVGLRNRARILTEVEDHLHEATIARLSAVRDQNERCADNPPSSEEEQWAEAQRRAVAAFGPPEEVAASFESGLLGAIDRRVAITARRLDIWLAHPLRGSVLRLVLALAAYAVVSGLAAVFHARWPLAGTAQTVLLLGVAWTLARGIQARALKGRPEPGFRARLRAGMPRPGWAFAFALRRGMQAVWPRGHGKPRGRARLAAGLPDGWARSTRTREETFTPFIVGWLTYTSLTSTLSILPPSLYGSTPSSRSVLHLCVALLVVGAVILCERSAAWAARKHPGESRAQKKRAWRAEHPWQATLLRILPMPLFSLPLLALSSTFPGSRLAVGLLLAGVTTVLALGVRLAQNADQKDTFECGLHRPG